MSPLVGCWSTHPAFPPDAAAVADIVGSLGFDWTLSEEDAVSYPDGRVTFSLYGEGYPEALIGCSGPREAKAMQLFFGMPILSERPRFAWEDWEDRFSLAEQLYGGFSDEGELYRAFSAQGDPRVRGPGQDAHLEGGAPQRPLYGQLADRADRDGRRSGPLRGLDRQAQHDDPGSGRPPTGAGRQLPSIEIQRPRPKGRGLSRLRNKKILANSYFYPSPPLTLPQESGKIKVCENLSLCDYIDRRNCYARIYP